MCSLFIRWQVDHAVRLSACLFAIRNRPGAFEKLRAARVFVSLRQNELRASPHIYNTPEEISRFMQFLFE